MFRPAFIYSAFSFLILSFLEQSSYGAVSFALDKQLVSDLVAGDRAILTIAYLRQTDRILLILGPKTRNASAALDDIYVFTVDSSHLTANPDHLYLSGAQSLHDQFPVLYDDLSRQSWGPNWAQETNTFVINMKTAAYLYIMPRSLTASSRVYQLYANEAVEDGPTNSRILRGVISTTEPARFFSIYKSCDMADDCRRLNLNRFQLNSVDDTIGSDDTVVRIGAAFCHKSALPPGGQTWFQIRANCSGLEHFAFTDIIVTGFVIENGWTYLFDRTATVYVFLSEALRIQTGTEFDFEMRNFTRTQFFQLRQNETADIMKLEASQLSQTQLPSDSSTVTLPPQASKFFPDYGYYY